MDIALKIHVEAAQDGSPVWWAESDDLRGLTASADSLPELRAVLADVLAEFGEDLASDSGHPHESIDITSERLIPVTSISTEPDAKSVDYSDQNDDKRPSPIQVLISA
jgi:predicted RNase H-like HicB family nuclease